MHVPYVSYVVLTGVFPLCLSSSNACEDIPLQPALPALSSVLYIMEIWLLRQTRGRGLFFQVHRRCMLVFFFFLGVLQQVNDHARVTFLRCVRVGGPRQGTAPTLFTIDLESVLIV